MNDYFAGKVVLITGGGAGLGRALASGIAGHGARVFILDIDETAANETVNKIRDRKGTAFFLKTDICSYEEFSAAVENIHRQEGRVDVLINNAGKSITGEARDMTIGQWRKVFDLNSLGSINGIALVYPEMARQGSGQIVTISSMIGLAPVPLVGPYVASKYALTGLSRSLRLEAKTLGIKINLVCPGRLETTLMDTSDIVLADRDKFLAWVPFRAFPVDKAARIIIRGMIQDKAMIIFPSYVKWLWWTERYLPFLLNPFYHYSIRKFREIRVEDR
jgi:NAD(P)-dependent dehydrogenase (short-subunit alcohol dehydrogenase family)